jgi:hypothetical protein
MNLEEDLDSLVANTPMKKDEYRISININKNKSRYKKSSHKNLNN